MSYRFCADFYAFSWFFATKQVSAFYFTASAAKYTMSQTSNVSLSYRDAGVDIDAGDELVRRIKPLVARTSTSRIASRKAASLWPV